MNKRSVGLAAILATISLAAASIVAGVMLPAKMQLPVHWGLSGEPDAFAGKWIALLSPAAMVALVSLVFQLMPVLEPRKEGLKRSEGLYLAGWIGILMVGATLELVLLSVAFGWGIPVNRLIVGSVGVMLMLIGNQLGKSRSMYLIGLRTPWTLASEAVWIKTHRLGGKLMVAGGLAMLMASLPPLPSGLLAIVATSVIVAAAGLPIVYSFVLWRRESRSTDQASR